jgi:hypothetical protein
MARREQGRHAPLPRVPREVNAGLLPLQPYVAEDEMNLFSFEDLQRFVEIIDGRDDLIAGVAEYPFIVECG